MRKYRGAFLKNAQEIDKLRRSNFVAVSILDKLGAYVAPGAQTRVLEEIALDLCKKYEAVPAFQGYAGFPYALCCSVNSEIVHGFPSDQVLREGDIVSLDFGVKMDGFFGDTARTFPVGTISKDAAHLLEVARNSLDRGIEMAFSGNDLYEISRAIQETVEGSGCTVVRRFVGHGIGRDLHEKPEIPNFVPENHSAFPLKSGMVLAIEPMVVTGSAEVEILSDGWTAVAKDGSLSAHFEHTVVITKKGPIILSQA